MTMEGFDPDLIDKPNILETNYYIGVYIKKDILTKNLNFINYNIREINSNQIYINELSNIYVGDLIRMNNYLLFVKGNYYFSYF